MTARSALKTRAFWVLASAAFFMQIGISAVHVHIVPYLESVNVPPTTAAMAVTGMTLCSLIGRMIFGFLGDFTSKRYLLTIALFFQTTGIFVFSFITSDKIWLIFLFLFTLFLTGILFPSEMNTIRIQNRIDISGSHREHPTTKTPSVV